VTIQETLITVEQFWELAQSSEYADMRLELVEGAIYAMPPAGGEHGEIAANLLISIGIEIRQRQLGHVTAAETGYILFRNDAGKDTVRAPDVGFVSFERWPERLPQKYIPVPPDLAIEVVSPTDMAEDIESKIDDYLRAGIRLFVFIYPATRTVSVYQNGSIARLSREDMIDFSAVLPGFSLRVSEIF
jgi:Uma2 family endonuclease